MSLTYTVREEKRAVFAGADENTVLASQPHLRFDQHTRDVVSTLTDHGRSAA